jgi:hypothetical protein
VHVCRVRAILATNIHDPDDLIAIGLVDPYQTSARQDLARQPSTDPHDVLIGLLLPPEGLLCLV